MPKLQPFAGGYRFQCPGCGHSHEISSGWQCNGDQELPTISPSILVTSGHYASNWKQGDACWCTYYAEHPEDAADNEKASRFACGVCHSFVTEGKIRFLQDCSHALAGQTVDLPEIV